MPELTRRRSPDAPEECWHVYWGDIRAGTIQIRSGIPFDEDPWGWSCGFFPGSHPGEHEDGTAATFEQARVDFDDAWQRFLSKRTEADFQVESKLPSRESFPEPLLIGQRAVIGGEALNATFGPPTCPPTNSATSNDAASKLPPIIAKKPMLDLLCAISRSCMTTLNV
jgi:hypothetical protein